MSGDSAERGGIDGLEAQIALESGPLAWLRARSTRERTILSIAISAALPAAVALTRLRQDWSVFPSGRMVFDLLLLCGALLALLSLPLRPLHRPPLSWPLIATLVGGAVATTFVVAAWPQAHELYPESLLGVDADFASRASGCFRTGVLWAAAVSLGLFLISRKSSAFPIALVQAALVAIIALQLHCPLVSPKHLVAGHSTVALAGLLVALLLMARRSRR